jgi:CheY-like chemotaxis protein
MGKLLIVEDDPSQRLLYQRELERAGYDVVTAKDGREALDLAARVGPDLVVLDIAMPGMDGIDAMTRMLSRDHRLPVVLNSSYASYKDNFRTWSADAYVVKSSDLSGLKNAISEVLKHCAEVQA